MSTEQQKTVIVVDRHLPMGLAVNAASIVSAMVASACPQIMGPSVRTADSELPGVVLTPLPVLAGDSGLLASLWGRAEAQGSGVDVFPFTRLAQGCRTYEEYVSRLGSALTRDLELAALGLRGPRRQVTSLTGDLPLYPAKDA
ncbi:DUF2000 domain-containing protein [Actinomyces lilanjuaniae]|uniref:DUF2000 domain-containing protein n=1 Tax=Actinomyces lilanjuaniae TaxID=2321394 RepID=A0ABN5PNE3_9ACTO|nr:DUF2000 domain-containing protein [Actinomyces lilanjuaniae]AYD89965.1 DUF2000 domain-containing protein [Actinomyces lilanjuaniae]